jgi:hypothetical protein
MKVRGSIAFAAWAFLGALTAVALAAAPSFGLFLLPVAIGAAVAVGRYTRAWPEALGALEGVAAVILLVGLANLGNSPCPASGELILRPGQHEASCGGLSPGPLLAAAAIIAVIGLVGYWRTRNR